MIAGSDRSFQVPKFSTCFEGVVDTGRIEENADWIFRELRRGAHVLCRKLPVGKDIVLEFDEIAFRVLLNRNPSIWLRFAETVHEHPEKTGRADQNECCPALIVDAPVDE